MWYVFGLGIINTSNYRKKSKKLKTTPCVIYTDVMHTKLDLPVFIYNLFALDVYETPEQYTRVSR